MKHCSSCNQEKPLDQFWNRTQSLDGKTAHCIACRKAYQQRWYNTNRDKAIAQQSAYRSKNLELTRERRRAYYRNHAEQVKANVRKWQAKQHPLKKRLYRYGITPADYEALLEAQSHMCAICYTRGELFVDHDHETGIVRGLLCERCNFGIGQFKNSAHLLNAACEYIVQSWARRTA